MRTLKPLSLLELDFPTMLKGVLMLTLPKTKGTAAHRIEIH